MLRDSRSGKSLFAGLVSDADRALGHPRSLIPMAG
jgi:hypothetical protein